MGTIANICQSDRRQYFKDYNDVRPQFNFRVDSPETRDLIRLQADLEGLPVADWVLVTIEQKLFDDVVRST
jgi:hypothetical protein